VAAVRILVDTDILIDYFNSGRYARLLLAPRAAVYYSVVTRKELLTKRGLRDAERRAIEETLRRFRIVPVTRAIAARYARVRAEARGIDREDALIAATAMEKRLPLMTRNWRHFRGLEGLTLFAGS
jgi:predicted nucleic acid-binding protein